jgi:hypothetical protein
LRKSFWRILLASVFILALAGICAADGTDHFYMGLGADAKNLDPHKATDTMSFTVLKHIHEPLFTVDGKTRELVPVLAEKYEIIDPQTYNSSLRVQHLKKLNDITDIVSFALLTAKRPSGEDEYYSRESYRNKITYEYPMLKLWELDGTELQSGDNPFDWALYAGKCALDGGRNERVKLDYLKYLIEKLDSVGWSHDEKLSLFRFMDMLLHPKTIQLQKEYDAFTEQRQKEGKSMLLSAYEERVMEKSRKEGIKEGRKEGLKEGAKKRALVMAAKMLSEGEPHEKILNYTGITSKELDKLIKDRAN